MQSYRKSTHTVYDNRYHVVWTTKYRYRVLSTKIARRVREVIREICRVNDIKIERGHISLDHVHMLVSIPPHISVSKFVQKVKGQSSRKMQMEFRELRQRFWGKHIWARGYFCATVGIVTDEQIKDYIEHHQDNEEEEFTIEQT